MIINMLNCQSTSRQSFLSAVYSFHLFHLFYSFYIYALNAFVNAILLNYSMVSADLGILFIFCSKDRFFPILDEGWLSFLKILILL